MRARFSVFMMLLGLVLLPGVAQAHPHVWVVMRSELVYAPDGTLTGVRQEWTFDEAFSAFALQGMARQKDGTYGDDVLKPLAEVNISSLKEYDYFVTAKSATARLRLKEPQDYYLTYKDDALTLHFTLPLARPLPARDQVSIDIYDPTYFVAYAFDEKDAVTLGGPQAAACNRAYRKPKELDWNTMQQLAAIPADPDALPEELFAITKGLTHRIEVRCP